MKILGIDISSSCTGYGLIEDGRLLDFGAIEPHGKLSEQQKLVLFGQELSDVINRLKPDEISIEDVVLVKSIVTAKMLSRFSAVARIEAYKYMKRDVSLYEPPAWKKKIGLGGGAEKCEVQIKVCQTFGLLSGEKIRAYSERISTIIEGLKNSKESLRESMKELKKRAKKDKKTDYSGQIKELDEKIKAAGSSLKKDAKKQLMAISQEIYVETRINNDIADAIGVALAYQVDT